MDVLEHLSAALSAAIGPLLIVIPLLLYRWVTDTAAHSEPYGPRRVDNATLAGLIVGVCLIAVTPLPGEPLSVDSIFMAGGPWDIRLGQFGALVIDRLDAAPWFLIERLSLDDERLNLTLGVGVAMALLLVRAATGFAHHGWRLSLQEIALDLVITTLTAALALYAAVLTLWLCNRLNFWLFLVAILMIQEYRYNVVGVFPKHRHFRLPRARLPLEAPVRAKATRHHR
ncbi:hypothetical protein [Azospirillum sp. sgz301742]